jgi:hypothetical protein
VREREDQDSSVKIKSERKRKKKLIGGKSFTILGVKRGLGEGK